MPDIPTKPLDHDPQWPTLVYIFIVGILLLIAALFKFWPGLIASAFIGIGGVVNLATQRICAAIRETK